MGFFVFHLIVYTAVNALFVAIWLLTRGSTDVLADIIRSPSEANALGFWPVWPILGWGTAVVIHAGGTLVRIVTAPGRRRRRRRAQRHLERMAPIMIGEPAAAKRPAQTRGAAGRQRRWVAVLFTDIAGSTEHNQRLGDEEWSAVLTRHRAAVRQAVMERQGIEVGTQGDGCLARFESPVEAVLCAIDIQRAHRESPVDVAIAGLALRIGVHAGEVVEDDGDLIGQVVNLASRVTDAAEPGEILVTEPVADHLAVPLDLDDRGLVELKGVSRPRHLLAVRWESGASAGEASGSVLA